MNAALLAATLAVYGLCWLFPEPTLAFYIGRGWLGVLFAWALWRGVKITGPVFAAVAAMEASTSVCGAVYAGAVADDRGMCDAGTGLPVTLLLLTGVLLAAVSTIGGTTKNRGNDG